MILLETARIIGAVAPPERGEGKRRPMVVTSTWPEIRESKLVAVICCSTNFYKPPREIEVPLGFKSDGRCVTKLREPTAAICDWKATIELADLGPNDAAGRVDTDLFREICAKAGVPLRPRR